MLEPKSPGPADCCAIVITPAPAWSTSCVFAGVKPGCAGRGRGIAHARCGAPGGPSAGRAGATDVGLPGAGRHARATAPDRPGREQVAARIDRENAEEGVGRVGQVIGDMDQLAWITV